MSYEKNSLSKLRLNRVHQPAKLKLVSSSIVGKDLIARVVYKTCIDAHSAVEFMGHFVVTDEGRSIAVRRTRAPSF